MRWLSLLTLPTLSGCILDAEVCGQGFVEASGRCVPARPAPLWYADGGAIRDAQLRPDEGPRDAAPDAFEQPPDQGVPDRWAPHKTLLVVDRGSRNDARRSPETPGFDLDAVGVFGPDGRPLGYLGAVVSAQLNDPFRSSRARDPRACLDAPDADGPLPTDRFTSLGSEGGFVFATLDLERPLNAGDRIVAFEVGADGGQERAELYVCLDEVLSLDRCRSVGSVAGTTEIFLPE